MAVRLTDIIAPSFMRCIAMCVLGSIRTMCLKAGAEARRAAIYRLNLSAASFKNPDAHAIVFRKIADTLRDSDFCTNAVGY